MDWIGIGLDWGNGLGLNNSIPMDWVGIGNIEVFQLSPVGSFQEFNPNGLDWDWIGLD